MLLSMKQRYIVKVLDKLGCIRRDQLYILTRDAFKTEDFTLSESQMDALLNRSSEMIALAKQMKFGEATDLLLEEGKAIRKLRQDLEHAYLDGERSDFKWQ